MVCVLMQDPKTVCQDLGLCSDSSSSILKTALALVTTAPQVQSGNSLISVDHVHVLYMCYTHTKLLFNYYPLLCIFHFLGKTVFAYFHIQKLIAKGKLIVTC